MVAGNEQDIILAFLASATVGSTFSEMMRTRNHSMSFLLMVTAYENYFKKKLYDVDYRLIFPNATSENELGRSINIALIPVLVEEYFNYQIDSSIMCTVVEKRNSLFHFAKNGTEPDLTLRVIFEIIIPFMEKFFPEDIKKFVNYIYEYDEVALDGYTLEQLDLHDIKYTDLISEYFGGNVIL